MGDFQKVNTLAEIRRDLLFNVKYPTGLLFEGEEIEARYNLADLIVQVFWLQDGTWHERYGVLVDFESTAKLGEKSYILEIPTTESESEKITEAQKAKVKEYIDEMRIEWKTLLRHVEWSGEAMLHDFWLQLDKWLNSVEGRWDLLMAFHDNTMPGSMPLNPLSRQENGGKSTPSKYKSFYHWLVAKEPTLKELQRVDISSAEGAAPELQRYWMPFLVGREVYVNVDWPVPYMCYAESTNVAHFETNSGSEKFFYPFHNFLTNFECSKVTPPSSWWKPDAEIGLCPTHYTPLLQWAHLIREIDRKKAESYKKLEPYYIYMTNIGLIESIFATYGPLRDLSTDDLVTLGQEASIAQPDYDGGVNDWDWCPVKHKQQIALGLQDLIDCQRLFASIVKYENRNGVNSTRSTEIEARCYELAGAFDSAISKHWYEDLWRHNIDPFGYDLFLLKTHSLLGQSHLSDEIYYSWARSHIYEHPTLDDLGADVGFKEPRAKAWFDQAYRSAEIVSTLWQVYYGARDKALRASAMHSAKSSTPSAEMIANWFRHSTPSAPVDWWLHDRGSRKLVNYLLGGNKMKELAAIEEDILRSIDEIVGNSARTKGAIPKATLDRIRESVIKAKLKGILSEGGIDLDQPKVTTMPIQIVINLFVVGVVWHAAEKTQWNSEAKLMVMAAGLGLTADTMSYVAFKRWGIQGTLSRSAIKRAAQKGMGKLASVTATRAAAALGAAEFIAGGVGGALGVVMYGFSAVSNYSAGQRKDAVLDGLAAAGCALTTAGLFLDATVVGVVPGVVCNIVGIAMMVVAEVTKHFSLWENEPEEYCKALYTAKLTVTPPGMESFDWLLDDFPHYFGKEFSVKEAKEMVGRVHELLSNWDTFDNFADSIPN